MGIEEIKQRTVACLIGVVGVGVIIFGLSHAVSHLIGAPKWAQQVALCYGACLGGRKLIMISCAKTEEIEK